MQQDLSKMLNKRYGRYKVIGLTDERSPSGKRKVICQCSCKNKTIKAVIASMLISGYTKSCGCLRAENTAKSNTLRKTVFPTKEEKLAAKRLDRIKQRCYNPHSINYKNYMAKGITVCDEWMKDTRKFVDWALSHGFRPELTVERIDNNLPYSPENCTIIPRREQPLNRNVTVMINVGGSTKSATDWAHKLKLSTKIRDDYLSGKTEYVESVITDKLLELSNP